VSAGGALSAGGGVASAGAARRRAARCRRAGVGMGAAGGAEAARRRCRWRCRGRCCRPGRCSSHRWWCTGRCGDAGHAAVGGGPGSAARRWRRGRRGRRRSTPPRTCTRCGGDAAVGSLPVVAPWGTVGSSRRSSAGCPASRPCSSCHLGGWQSQQSSRALPHWLPPSLSPHRPPRGWQPLGLAQVPTGGLVAGSMLQVTLVPPVGGTSPPQQSPGLLAQIVGQAAAAGRLADLHPRQRVRGAHAAAAVGAALAGDAVLHAAARARWCRSPCTCRCWRRRGSSTWPVQQSVARTQASPG
jgi:hypothetical protein